MASEQKQNLAGNIAKGVFSVATIIIAIVVFAFIALFILLLYVFGGFNGLHGFLVERAPGWIIKGFIAAAVIVIIIMTKISKKRRKENPPSKTAEDSQTDFDKINIPPDSSKENNK
ncbi:MAG: hypothetical protein FWF35_03235 [Elusimicrobia bacterium]|nr:hypothetical protein [Elusimicrobiota bacterium]